MRETRQTVAHHRFSRWNYFPVLWQPLSVFTFSSRSLFLPRFVTTLEFHGNRCEKLSIILLSQNFYGIINSWYRNEMYFGNKQLNIVKIFYAYQRWRRCRNSYYFITMKLKLNTFKSETVITIALLFLKKQKKKKKILPFKRQRIQQTFKVDIACYIELRFLFRVTEVSH